MRSHEDPMEQARRMANTPEGKQLIQLLRQMGGSDLQSIMDQAAAGDMRSAKDAITRLLQDPKARQLLQQLGGSYGK